MSYILYGSPHSLPTYKVALMLRMAGQGFAFRYVSFQKGMQNAPAFQAMSRWGQVPVLLDGDRTLLQSAAIIEYLSARTGKFAGENDKQQQDIREWMYWDADVLFPPIFACYGVRLGQQKLLPIQVAPEIAEYHRHRAGMAVAKLDDHLPSEAFLCGEVPTIADICCHGDLAFAEICEFDLTGYEKISNWSARMTALPGYAAPFDLLDMKDADFPQQKSNQI